MKNSLFNSLRKLTIFFILLFFTLSGFAAKVALIYPEPALVVSSKIILCTEKDDTSNTITEEKTTSLYVNPNTTIVRVEYINLNTKLFKEEKEQTHLYMVENTIFFSSHDLAVVIIKDNDAIYTAMKSKENKVIHEFVKKTNKHVVKDQNNTQVKQIPFPFSLPSDKKLTLISAVSITIVTPSTFSKTVSKTFTIGNSFILPIRIRLSQKQATICFNKNSKPFQVKIKYCNRPPPVSYC